MSPAEIITCGSFGVLTGVAVLAFRLLVGSEEEPEDDPAASKETGA